MQPLTETVSPSSAMSVENREAREHPRDYAGHVTVIVPESGWVPLDLGELWRYRDLLMLLAWRDIAARYRQSVIGYGWAILKPVLSMAIFTFIFNRVADIKSDGSPYPLFAFTGMLPWLYFSNTIMASTASVVTSSGMLTKVYFPRMVLPVSSIVVGLVELAIQGIVLAALIWYFNGAAVPTDSAGNPETWRFTLGWRTLCLPLFLGLCVLSALSVGLWLTALNVKYRDVGQAVPFLVQAWMWLSPVVYPSSLVSPELRPYYGLNPMAGVIEGFRWSILGSTTPDWTMMGVSTAVVLVLLTTGLYYFKRIESTFADII
jgi:lipopolysaccharide transport system permease protein